MHIPELLYVGPIWKSFLVWEKTTENFSLSMKDFFPNQFFICISCIWSKLHFLNSFVKMPSISKELHKSDYQIYLVLPAYPLGQLACQEGNSDGLAYFVKSWQIHIALSLAPYYLPAVQNQINHFFLCLLAYQNVVKCF